MRDWFYDESCHVGVDYSEKANADVYDEQMDFRDYENEVTLFIEKLGIENPENLIAVDIGCGTGAFSIHAAQHFKKVHAVDVSGQMLGIAKDKAVANRIDNIEFSLAGFLQFQPKESVDVINSKWALHHLPDYWKQAALLNMNSMLKPGGLLFLADVIFQFDPDFEENTEAMLADLRRIHEEAFVEECKTHIREEFSTFDWILEGMIKRAGFEIVSVDTEETLATEYVCRKVADV